MEESPDGDIDISGLLAKLEGATLTTDQSMGIVFSIDSVISPTRVEYDMSSPIAGEVKAYFEAWGNMYGAHGPNACCPQWFDMIADNWDHSAW